jgi:hypothetical protein
LSDAYQILRDPREALRVTATSSKSPGPGRFPSFSARNLRTESIRKQRSASACYAFSTANAARILTLPRFPCSRIENIMAFPRERLLFARWYLRARHVVEDGRSSFIISADGLDYLES